MNASLAYRWRYAEKFVLLPLYGKQTTEAVLSRPARKPVSSAIVRSAPNGLPIPVRRCA
jgi:hypothetical protein